MEQIRSSLILIEEQFWLKPELISCKTSGGQTLAIHQESCPRKSRRFPPHKNHRELLEACLLYTFPVWLLTSGLPNPNPKVYDLRPGTQEPLSITCQHTNAILIPLGARRKAMKCVFQRLESHHLLDDTQKFMIGLPVSWIHKLFRHSPTTCFVPACHSIAYSARLTLDRNLASLDQICIQSVKPFECK